MYIFLKKLHSTAGIVVLLGALEKKKIIISKESVRGKKDFWRMKANKKRPQTGPKKRHPIETQLLGMASMLYAVYFTSPLAIVTTKRPTTATILNT